MANSKNFPEHIAIICDGNRRWAKAHAMTVFQGHEIAVEKIFEPLIFHAQERGIKFITFWIFSTENWDRDPKEVDWLMDLFRRFFDNHIQRLSDKEVRVNVIGDVNGFAPDIQEKIHRGMKETKDNPGIVATLAMNYGGRDEITRAVKKIAQEVAEDKLKPEDVNKDLISQHLDTGRTGIPDPDLIVRTSGENRLSGYMMWQCEYSEFWFPQFHFPEFTPDRLDEAIEVFEKRQRRFGK